MRHFLFARILITVLFVIGATGIATSAAYASSYHHSTTSVNYIGLTNASSQEFITNTGTTYQDWITPKGTPIVFSQTGDCGGRVTSNCPYYGDGLNVANLGDPLGELMLQWNPSLCLWSGSSQRVGVFPCNIRDGNDLWMLKAKNSYSSEIANVGQTNYDRNGHIQLLNTSNDNTYDKLWTNSATSPEWVTWSDFVFGPRHGKYLFKF